MTIAAQLGPKGSIHFLIDVPSDEDEINGMPGLGSAGHVLSRAMRAAGLSDTAPMPGSFLPGRTREVARLYWERRHFSVSTVLDFPVGRAGIQPFCRDARGREQCLKDGTLPTELAGLPGLPRTGYATDPMWVSQLSRLRKEICGSAPNIVVSLGDLALWSLTGQASTDEWRGAPRLVAPTAPIMRGATEAEARFLAGLKVFPTYPPSRINAQYKLMIPLMADLLRVAHEARHPEIRPIEIEVWLEPDLRDLDDFFLRHVRDALLLSLDIETAAGQIVCVQIGTAPNVAITVPFVDYRKPSRSYWGTAEDELAAWDWVEKVLGTPIPKLGQNFAAYDLYWLMDKIGISVRNYRHDLRLAHHLLQPELPKSLSFLGATYTNMPSWKAAVHHGGTDDKRDS